MTKEPDPASEAQADQDLKEREARASASARSKPPGWIGASGWRSSTNAPKNCWTSPQCYIPSIFAQARRGCCRERVGHKIALPVSSPIPGTLGSETTQQGKGDHAPLHAYAGWSNVMQLIPSPEAGFVGLDHDDPAAAAGPGPFDRSRLILRSSAPTPPPRPARPARAFDPRSRASLQASPRPRYTAHRRQPSGPSAPPRLEP